MSRNIMQIHLEKNNILYPAIYFIEQGKYLITQRKSKLFQYFLVPDRVQNYPLSLRCVGVLCFCFFPLCTSNVIGSKV